MESLDDRCLLSMGMVPSGMGDVAAMRTHHPSPPLVTSLATAPHVIGSTIAPNGDQNPYGVAFVPVGFRKGGKLNAGDVLVSDFNDSTPAGNTQGTGTSIVRITPQGQTSLFNQDSNAVGLTTALGVLQRGFVLSGNLPNMNGNIQQGSLRILDRNGNVVQRLTDPAKLDGPWDLTVVDHGNQAMVFVSNVLNGTVTRINLRIPGRGTPVVTSMTTIASGYKFGTNMAALVVGPTGMAFDAKRDILYVASTADNAIFAVPNALKATSSAGTGSVVVPTTDPHLHGPLGLVLAPNGDLVASNGDAIDANSDVNEIVEYTASGQFVTEMPVDNTGTAGGAFGIALTSSRGQTQFAAVDDNTNSVTVWSIPQGRGR